MMKNKTKKKSWRKLKIKKMKHHLSRHHKRKFPKRGNQKKNYRNAFILTRKQTGMKYRGLSFLIIFSELRINPNFLHFSIERRESLKDYCTIQMQIVRYNILILYLFYTLSSVYFRRLHWRGSRANHSTANWRSARKPRFLRRALVKKQTLFIAGLVPSILRTACIFISQKSRVRSRSTRHCSHMELEIEQNSAWIRLPLPISCYQS